MSSNGPPLFVPDLSAPAGAAVDAHGHVACVTCGTRKPLAQMDVVGQGYRCPACSHKAQMNMLLHGDGDVGANLSSGDRSALSSNGMKFIAGGVGLTALGGVLMVATVGNLGKYFFFGGIGWITVGVGRTSLAKSR